MPPSQFDTASPISSARSPASEPGKGTTFKIYLPVAAGAAEPSPPPVDVQALRGTETVLVVEDQVDVRGVIEKTLSRYGYTVIAAANGPEAIATAQEYQGPIDVMLTDVVLPGATGREIWRRTHLHSSDGTGALP